MNQHQPRQHRDIGGIPRCVCREIDTGAHAPPGPDPEDDVLRQIRGIGSTSAAEDRHVPDDGCRFSSRADDLSRSGTIVEVDLAAAPGGMSGTGRRVSADFDARFRVRDICPMAFGTIRQRMPHGRARVLRHVGVPETTAALHGLLAGAPPYRFESAADRARIARDRRGLWGRWHIEPPAAQRIRAIVPTAGQGWVALARRPTGTVERQGDGPAAPLDEGRLFAVTVPGPEGATP